MYLINLPISGYKLEINKTNDKFFVCLKKKNNNNILRL